MRLDEAGRAGQDKVRRAEEREAQARREAEAAKARSRPSTLAPSLSLFSLSLSLSLSLSRARARARSPPSTYGSWVGATRWGRGRGAGTDCPPTRRAAQSQAASAVEEAGALREAAQRQLALDRKIVRGLQAEVRAAWSVQ